MRKIASSGQNIYSLGLRLQQRIEVVLKDYSLDVRIHHRIWDAQKHLIHTIVKPKKEIFDNSTMNMTMRQIVSSHQNMYSLDVRLQQTV